MGYTSQCLSNKNVTVRVQCGVEAGLVSGDLQFSFSHSKQTGTGPDETSGTVDHYCLLKSPSWQKHVISTWYLVLIHLLPLAILQIA